ncbi:COesterase domain-containing protein [Aphelenchoides bicaudatus]|nr:COesterase domain-containing protein [Aphelenchoides bicaudatus]
MLTVRCVGRRLDQPTGLALSLLLVILEFVDGAQLRKTHPIELTIKSGSIRGEQSGRMISQLSKAFHMQRKDSDPPVGSLRFMPPEDPSTWRGVMNATQYAPACAQFPRTRPTDPEHLYKIHISEDCLYLNVFAPPQFTNDTYPVIVWIHGGNFQSGSSSDYPQGRDFEQLCFEKRFLATGDGLTANNGLHDMILALNWVHENAHVFGGDPSNVLLMGQGSGASAASILALSPRAEGLFHKVVLMSGTAVTPGAVRDTAVNATWTLDQKLHCRSFNSTELVDCLRKQLKDEILDASRNTNDDYEQFVPIVDGVGNLIPESPEILATYRPKIPIMIGTTRDESSLRLLLLDEKNINFTTMDRMIAEELTENLTSSYSGFTNHLLIAQGCKNEYVWTKMDFPPYETHLLSESILNMYSHFWYDAPAARLATHYLEHAPVYVYSFDHVSENFDTDRAFHGVDEIFLFEKEPRFLETHKDKNWQLDKRVTEIFSDLIVNFLKYDNPTPDHAGFSFIWNTTKADTLDYLSITDTPEMKVGYRWSGHVFWNWYARHLDAVDVGNLQKISQLDKQLGDYQLATWMLLFCALFFFAILVALACYCTRKEPEDDDL